MKRTIAILLLSTATLFADNSFITNDGDHPVPVTGSDITVNTTVDLTHIISVPGATPSPSPAKAMVVQGIAGATPVAVTPVSVSGAGLSPAYSASHITTKTTTTPVSSTCYVASIAICVTGAGTTQTLVIQNKEGTAKTLYTAGTAISVGNTYIQFSEPILMTGGIDIVTGGTTAGTQDIFISYYQ